MINLSGYSHYWRGMVKRVQRLTGCMAVTVDDGMAKLIMNIPRGAVTLFFLPPAAQSTSQNVDAFSEDNDCVVFVMEKYDPQRRTAFDVLESTQEVIEGVKSCMINDVATGCPIMKFDISSLNTLPETKFFAGYAGWSIGFKIKT